MQANGAQEKFTRRTPLTFARRGIKVRSDRALAGLVAGIRCPYPEEQFLQKRRCPGTLILSESLFNRETT